jgi:hypothetical protein
MRVKINLYISLYEVTNIERKNEILEVLKKNLHNPNIDNVIILSEPNDNISFQSAKIKKIDIQTRPKFSEFSAYLDPGCINIIINNDIEFPEQSNITWLKHISSSDCITLTRYESDGKLFRSDRGDSQDTWIFKGNPDGLKYCDFHMGMPGCDNRIAYIFFALGYRVLNPSKSLKTIHHHKSEYRLYSENDRIPGPYLNVKPTTFLQSFFIKLVIVLLSKIHKQELSIK